jgi:hypothetical protein
MFTFTYTVGLDAIDAHGPWDETHTIDAENANDAADRVRLFWERAGYRVLYVTNVRKEMA